MTLFQLVNREKERLLTEKAALEKSILDAPSGTITFCKNRTKGRTYYKWFVRNSRSKRRYLRRKEKELAKMLARKSLEQARLQDINHELKALDAYLGKHCKSLFLEKLTTSPGIGELIVGNEIKPPPELAEELEKWANDKYEMNPKFPEMRNILTEQGIKVRSKSEAIILMLLTMYHIPFRYECRLEVGGRVLYPDFTIRHPLTGEFFYWEHCGMMEKSMYRSDYMNKMHVYISNGIWPDHNLILTYESEGHPLDISIVMDKIEEFFFCNREALK